MDTHASYSSVIHDSVHTGCVPTQPQTHINSFGSGPNKWLLLDILLIMGFSSKQRMDSLLLLCLSFLQIKVRPRLIPPNITGPVKSLNYVSSGRATTPTGQIQQLLQLLSFLFGTECFCFFFLDLWLIQANMPDLFNIWEGVHVFTCWRRIIWSVCLFLCDHVFVDLVRIKF